MKLLILSDLHLEFAPFTPDPKSAEEADVVVLSGDIVISEPPARGRHTLPVLRPLAESFSPLRLDTPSRQRSGRHAGRAFGSTQTGAAL